VDIAVSLWDTSGGGEDYDRLRPLSYPQTDVFILLFSVISPTSYGNVKSKWWPEVMHHCPTDVVVVANKIDCRDDPEKLESLKEKGLALITTEQGKQLAADVKAKGYAEISALTGQGVRAAFELVYDIYLENLHGGNTMQQKNNKNKCVLQ